MEVNPLTGFQRTHRPDRHPPDGRHVGGCFPVARSPQSGVRENRAASLETPGFCGLRPTNSELGAAAKSSNFLPKIPPACMKNLAGACLGSGKIHFFPGKWLFSSILPLWPAVESGLRRARHKAEVDFPRPSPAVLKNCSELLFPVRGWTFRLASADPASQLR